MDYTEALSPAQAIQANITRAIWMAYEEERTRFLEALEEDRIKIERYGRLTHTQLNLNPDTGKRHTHGSRSMSKKCKCVVCKQKHKKILAERAEKRRAQGIPAARVAQHGTYSKYVRGCRCEECMDASRAYTKKRREKKMKEEEISLSQRFPVIETEHKPESKSITRHADNEDQARIEDIG
jgi:hypothetical protein